MAYSTQRSVSDGTLQLLMIEIEFFDKSEITAYFDNIPTTAFVWATDKSIMFNSVVPNGVEVLLRRTTDLAAPRHIFSDGAQFKASTLDEDFKQILHIAQEAVEGANVGDIYQTLNMHGNTIANVGLAVADGDAISLGQVRTESLGAYLANQQAQAAAAAASASQAASAASASTASTQAGVATTQAGIATSAVGSIGGSVAAAAASASAAAGSQTAAGASATLAQQWAANPEDSVVSGGLYSAYHYSRKALASAAAAAASAASVSLPSFTGKGGYNLVVNAAATAWELVENVTKAAFDALVARVATLEARAVVRTPQLVTRVVGTSYTNTLAYPIVVYLEVGRVSGDAVYATVTYDGVLLFTLKVFDANYTANIASTGQCTFVVEPGKSWIVTGVGGVANITRAVELK